jgi:hypothetical protein
MDESSENFLDINKINIQKSIVYTYHKSVKNEIKYSIYNMNRKHRNLGINPTKYIRDLLEEKDKILF